MSVVVWAVSVQAALIPPWIPPTIKSLTYQEISALERGECVTRDGRTTCSAEEFRRRGEAYGRCREQLKIARAEVVQIQQAMEAQLYLRESEYTTQIALLTEERDGLREIAEQSLRPSWVDQHWPLMIAGAVLVGVAVGGVAVSR